MRARYFHGWNVVGATFVMALLSFGLGFYGVSVYVATLQRLHGWSASAVSAPVTVYYVAGALLTAVMSDLYSRFGPRAVVGTGAVAMAAGLLLLGRVSAPWQLYPAFLVMSVGWGAMSGAAVNIILAPWFERRRGLAVSLAFNGATLGGARPARRARGGCAGDEPQPRRARARPRRRPCAPAAPGRTRERRGALAACRARHVALLERVRALRSRSGRAGGRAHAPGCLGGAGARSDCGRPSGERGDCRGGAWTARHRARRRPAEPPRCGERDPLHPGGRPRPPRVGPLGCCPLRGLRPLRPRRGESHDPAWARPGCRVAARALQLPRRPRGRDQPVHVRVRAVAGRCRARHRRWLPDGARRVHGARSRCRRPRPARAREGQRGRARRAAPGAYTSGLTTLIGRCPVSTRATSSPQRRGT